SPSFRHPMSRAHRDRHSFPTRRSSDLDFLQGESGSGTYTVLKVPHHGSDGAATEAFLEQNNARYALISAGKDNPYGHPGEKLLRSEEHTSELQSRFDLVCRLLLEKKKR